MRAPDGVNRRKIDDVESQGGKLGQARDAVVEGSVPARDAGLAAWEHLVPGAGARQRRIDHQGKTRAAGQVGTGLMVGHDVAERFRQQRLRIAGSVEPAARRLDDRARALVPRRDVGEQFPALLGFQIEFLPGFALEQEVASPGGERIGPGFDRVNIADRLIGSETCGPAIVVVEAHGPSMPAFLSRHRGARRAPPR